MSKTASSGPPPDTPRKPAPPPPPAWRRYLLPAGVLITAVLLFLPAMHSSPSPEKLIYSDMVNRVNAGQVTSVTINNTGSVSGKLKDGHDFTSQIPIAITSGTENLLTSLQAHKVAITGKQSSGTSWVDVLLSFLPLLLIVGFFVWSGRAARRQLASGIGGIGRSKAKVTDAERPSTRFTDVAGYEGAKQEITEVVDFLRNPGRYAKAGAVGPRGVLMVGPPGTGKTLLARAVAGEAGVPFLSITGSEFVELFVGVGASRVRDLFGQARKMAPSIIFIDEVDAIGGRRGGGAFATNDEREQTLNQLLAEMDGFDQGAEVVVLAATNRPETLDPALLRPGRFDRQVVVPLPNLTERTAILRVHARGKALAPDVDLDRVARGTPGFSGADLANLLNEAAIVAVRGNRDVVTAADIDAARDRLLLGRREASNALLGEERHSVAVHEAGHALVAALSPHADPVAKVTILPAGSALGVTEQLPEVERHLYSESYLKDTLAVRLGGRAAELIVFGEGSTGASNDLAGATSLATRMVVEFGLSDALGPVGYASDAPEYLGTSPDGARGHPYSEQTQRLVDTEVARLLREAEARAVELLRAHRGELDRLAELLMAEETVDGSVVEATVRGVVLRKPQVLTDARTHTGTQPVTHAKSRKDAALLPEPATSTETDISGS
ncbi:MAG TPA: ATP-dependent zinc metalloprotease FtsH [Jatrophihabitantaceae bacterium]|jgi:cell division protease FtsH